MIDLSIAARAMRAADWDTARAHYEAALREGDSPEARDGLGLALWWLNHIPAAHEQRALAYNGYKARGDDGRAALIACWLGREQLFLNANTPAMQGWFARAERLLQNGDFVRERAWFRILRDSVIADVHELAVTAREITQAARDLRDSDLEAFALAFYGQALVTLGRMGEGMAALDEAMTMATGGEVGDLNVISEVFCVMLSACATAGDLSRSEHWCATAAAFAERNRCPFLSAYCRTSYGALMTALGRWREAETALNEAIHAFEQGHRGLRVHAIIQLADLRLSQGKVEEAAVMLAGLEDQHAAVVPLARMHIAKGEAAYACALLEQRLPTSGTHTLADIPLLFALVDVLLLLDDAPAAAQRVEALAAIAAQADSRLFSAQVDLARGRVCLHGGDIQAAKAQFDHALDLLKTYEQSLLAGQVRLHMAQTLRESDPVGATAWAKGALATFTRIGAMGDAAAAAALLRGLGVATPAAARTDAALTAREREIAALIASGMSNREIAERLVISAKTVEHHVGHIFDKLDLRSRAELAAYVAAGKL
jgi:DNA-binding CsgD family transcriptional regulator